VSDNGVPQIRNFIRSRSKLRSHSPATQFDPTISPRQAEDEEEEPTDEEERQAEDEEEDEEEMALEAAGVDITIIDVEEENSDREDEPV